MAARMTTIPIIIGSSPNFFSVSGANVMACVPLVVASVGSVLRNGTEWFDVDDAGVDIGVVKLETLVV